MTSANVLFSPVLRIRIRSDPGFLGHPNPDPDPGKKFTDPDPDPDPSSTIIFKSQTEYDVKVPWQLFFLFQNTIFK